MPKTLQLLAFILCLSSYGQICPRLQSPANGSIEVPVNTIITWDQRNDGIDGYLISLGTTPGGTDILNRRSAGLVNSFEPELGLPDDTRIYVTISLFVTNGTLIVCPGETFTTEDVIDPPLCTRLVSPEETGNSNGSINWAYAPTATGYRVTAGTTRGGADLANNVDVGNVLSYRPPLGLPQDKEIFIRIVPYNENGAAVSCQAESMIYSQPVLDCTPFLPMLNIPDQIGNCPGEAPPTLSNDVGASGYRWFKIEDDDSEILLSENKSFSPIEIGQYRYEAYNLVSEDGVAIECGNSKEFNVVRSEAPMIMSIAINRQTFGLEIIVNTEGQGSYEYALDSELGPYQQSHIFQNVSDGEHVVFVRDRNGCGAANRTVELDLSHKNFPAFFTPNQDGFNDFWQFIPLPESVDINVEYIRIFDRYGNLIKQLDPKSRGWDGSFMGKLLPESDYWYLAASFSGQVVHGHFTLKR